MKQSLGPVMSYLLSIWRAASNSSHNDHNWHSHSPLFRNHKLLSGNKPFVFSDWSDKGINVLADVWGDNDLQSFNDLRAKYNLPGTSFFFYLHLRSAMRTYVIPWGSSIACLTLHTLLTSC